MKKKNVAVLLGASEGVGLAVYTEKTKHILSHRKATVQNLNMQV
jgi:hypothetical protein